jgi:hypothetical protein
MTNPGIKMHGPEHHFLVPAVLITAYYNKTGKPEMIPGKLKIARERAKNVPGGACGFYGSCGTGLGTGLFMSIVLRTTPLSTDDWTLSNLMTAEALYEIAMMGGPRCCKRTTFLALETATDFVRENLGVELERSEVVCSFFSRNKECKQTECKYFPGSKKYRAI